MEQIKALKNTDLRIGNYITSGNNGKFDPNTIEFAKVLDIGNDERDFEQIYCEYEDSFSWLFKDNYFGIPLDEEILLKCGFEKDVILFTIIEKDAYNSKFLIQYDSELKLFKTPVQGFFYELKYLHQLQNLYFALTGTELEINLSKQ